MITRETRKLTGLVKKIESEFAVFETIDGKLTETRHQSAGYSIYDFGGKLIEEVSPYRMMMYDAYKDIYIYDKQGDLQRRDEFDENNTLIGETVFERLNNGDSLEKHYYFDKRGIIKLGSHTIYDGENNNDEDDSNVIERASYDENEKISPRHLYKYNSSERVKKNTIFTDNGYSVEEFRLNEKKEFSHRIVSFYDGKGNRTEHFCYESDGTLYLKDEFVYEFDSIGNWTKVLNNHWVIGWGEFRLVPMTITRRRIEYY